MAEQHRAALEGVRVVELATVLAGPGAGKYLADFGAEVIKVEAPGGDPTRRMGWIGAGETVATLFKLVTRNNEVISLDPKSPAGKDALWSLLERRASSSRTCARASSRPWASHPRISQAQSRLVMLRVSGFGRMGPAQHPGFATLAGLGGFSALLGEPCTMLPP